MKLQRFRGNPVLTASKKNKWEAAQVFNPSVVYENGVFHMLYRAVASGPKPFWGGFSSIGYASSKDGVHFKRSRRPLIKPEYPWEKFACEDPRITKLGNIYYIFYTTVTRDSATQKIKARIGLATTKNFKTIHKHGVVGPDFWSKAGMIFPEKIRGKILMLFTAFADSPRSSIVYAAFKSEKELLRPGKEYWKRFLKTYRKQRILFSSLKYRRGPEAGASPIKTKKGWLLIYCGPAKKEKVWPIHAALLDLKDPTRVLAYTKNPILKPEEKYELEGAVDNVTFPEGAVIVKDKLYVYYGAADKSICLATCTLSDLLRALR